MPKGNKFRRRAMGVKVLFDHTLTHPLDIKGVREVVK